MKRIFAIVVATPILTLFVGVGTLALGVAGKWDERNGHHEIVDQTTSRFQKLHVWTFSMFTAVPLVRGRGLFTETHVDALYSFWR